MTKDMLAGALVGAAAAAISIAGNIARGDRQLVSVFPFLLAGVVAPVAVVLLFGGRTATSLRQVWCTAVVAGGVFGIALAVFFVRLVVSHLVDPLDPRGDGGVRAHDRFVPGRGVRGVAHALGPV